MYYCVIFVEKSSLKLNELSSGEDIQEWLKEKKLMRKLLMRKFGIFLKVIKKFLILI